MIARLPAILEEIQPKGITHWVLQYLEGMVVHECALLHFSSMQEIEEASVTERGLMLGNDEFLKFVAGIHDISFATFIALTDQESIQAKFILQNFDSSGWHLETNDPEIIQRLFDLGWEESEYPPEYQHYSLATE